MSPEILAEKNSAHNHNQTAPNQRELLIDIWRTRFDGFNNYYHNILLAASEQQLLQWTTQLSAVKDISELLGTIPEESVISPRTITLINLLETKFGTLPPAHLNMFKTATAHEVDKLLPKFFNNQSPQKIVAYLVKSRKWSQRFIKLCQWLPEIVIFCFSLIVISPIIWLAVTSVIAPNTPDLITKGMNIGICYLLLFIAPLIPALIIFVCQALHND